MFLYHDTLAVALFWTKSAIFGAILVDCGLHSHPSGYSFICMYVRVLMVPFSSQRDPNHSRVSQRRSASRW